MSNLIELQKLARARAERDIGVGEVGGNNRGPRIRQYQERLDLPPGSPWCLAAIFTWYDEAAEQLGMKSPLPPTGKVVRLWQRSRPIWRSDIPSRGAIAIHLSDLIDPDTDGHCGIVLQVLEKHVVTVEGNTNDKGDRDSKTGDKVMVKTRPRSYWIGFVDVAREGPEPEARVA